ncbi:MAG: hypothetical protein L6R38_007993 [Xanthoria sp. 2 TBL-2021]|nr:MAG: hypothetical protein L6R38_007993 [Xanthoria sp. 2 TBL-2021]
MADYKYTPLDEEAGEIRLLTLLPGRFNTPICITLETKILSSKKIPKFTALSYAWGSDLDCLDIHVVAKRGVQGVKSATLSVTRNLFEGLKHLRQKRRATVLWIDQLCVDQRNLEERGKQVLRMPDIYSLAQGVIVWLGPESVDSNFAMTLLNNVGQDVTVDWAAWECYVDPSSTFDFDGLHLSSQQWLSITNLLSRSWFERLWVVQEICLATKWVCMLCGFKSIPSATFSNAIFYLRGKYDCYNATQRDILVGAMRLSRSKAQGWFSLERVLHETRHRKCSNKKDRVYAVLSLLPERERLGIHPDYTISAPDVFENIILQRLKYKATLSMLHFCSTKDRSRDIPSWVPDWSTDHKISPFQIVSADFGARAHAYSVSKGVLAVTGVRVTVVHEVKNDLPRSIPEDRTKSAKVFRQLLSTWVGQDHSDSSLSKLHSLCVTLCAGMFSEKHIPSDYSWPIYKHVHDYLSSLHEWSLPESAEPPELCSLSLGVIRTINTITRGRLLITTVDGRLGLAPEGTLSGDLVCVMLGCRSPLILRSNNSLSHEVVGECYIDGIMAGEALLGELPRNQMLVEKYFPDHRKNYYVLVDSDTGNIHLQDPRLGPLPAGWRIGNHEEDDAINWYVNDITGEDFGFRDPRLEPDALRARGVEIQEFRLV